MTVSRCLGEAIAITARPRGEWPELIEKIQDKCTHTDCTATNCREVCKEWLRMQWRIQIFKKVKT